jgi:cell wall-associated NlpC family hydrolase
MPHYNNNVIMTTKRSTPPFFIHAALLTMSVLLGACAGPDARRDASLATQKPIVISAEQRSEVVLMAVGLLESRYKYGGTHPGHGFDCSGLVAYVFQQAAQQSLPHNTAQIARLSRPISTRKLKAGDLVFFNTLNRPNSHMGIYIGDGQFVNAPSTGGRVRIDSLSNPYFAKRFESARTLFAS